MVLFYCFVRSGSEDREERAAFIFLENVSDNFKIKRLML